MGKYNTSNCAPKQHVYLYVVIISCAVIRVVYGNYKGTTDHLFGCGVRITLTYLHN